MPPGSSSTGGIRGFFKSLTRRVKKAFRSPKQASTPRASSPQPQPQPQPPPGTSLSQLTPTHQRPSPPPTQSQQPVHLPRPVPSASGSTSTANLVAVDDVRPVNAESRMALVAKQAGADAWTGLIATLRLVEKSSDVFPPLKSAVAGFLGVVDIFETAAQNRRDYAELALNIQGLLDEFREHPEEHTSSKMSEALKAMANNLEKEMGHVVEQRQRSGFRSYLEAGQDVDDVQECHRHVEVLCRELQNRAVLKTWSVVGEQQVDAHLKKLDAALKAKYNSKLSAVVGRRACTPGTREVILAEMQKWADDGEGPKVYWLNGMAGTGKTTLAYSFCAEMRQTSRLGASFFCSRGDLESQDASRIVPTIAHQLARLSPSYCEALVRQIGEDKDIGEWDITTQFEKLIRAPLGKAKVSVPEGIVVTIDALDECDRRDGAQNILDVLFLHARDLPIKFLVTSRPEPGLFDAVQSKDERYRSVFHLHNVEASFVQADIRIYLQAELGAISLSSEKLELLAKQAGTLFIYAATAVRYIRPGSRRANCHRNLDDLLAVVSKSGADKHRDIDRLYIAVLAAPFADEDIRVREKEHIRLVLDTAICAREPMSVAAMAKLLELEEEDVMCALQHLRSVLHVSQDGDLISTLHASFPDFMLDGERSNDLCCNSAKHHHYLSLRCLSTMSRSLRFNICELETSFDLDEHIPNLAKKIESAISPELFYACRYWADHLVFVEALDNVHSALEEFLSHRLLFWMEVMNLNHCINIGARGLFRVQAWTQGTSCPIDLQQLARDAAGFVMMFSSNPVSRSTPHIYISALPFWPEQRPLSKHYLPKMQGLPQASGTAMGRRDSTPLAICTTPSYVFAVAYSSDGARIVSGSDDNTIRVWDAHTGTMIGALLEGHTRAVLSVAYSTDGARIVSGSEDKTIRVWDAHTGTMIGAPLEGHTGGATSVAYSTDGARIVSGSYDNTIRVWDAHTGTMIGAPLKGHTRSVLSVAYSTDGARIVSGSDDKTIRVWDAHTGTMIGAPLEGHTRAVLSVAYSTDGAHIVSGSSDKTIRVWDAHTGTMIGAPLEGHTRAVLSVAYSTDGAHIVSGSDDNTIRVWDAHTGTMIGTPLKGHTDAVMSIACSTDGARIVSGSYDNTIRVWDACMVTMIGTPLEGHTGYVRSVAYLTDGARIVSGSYDNTIRVWDAHTGKMIGTPLKGHTGAVMSIAYSTDGARIVSGSEDKTIRVWDAHTGTMIGAPLEGHTGGATSVAYSTDGARIVSGSDDNTIRVWDAHMGTMIGAPLKGHTRSVLSVAYSTDGARIVSGSDDNTIRVWDVHTGTMIGTPLEGHTGAVWSVAYSTDSTRIVSGSDDNTIRVWDAHTGTMIGTPLEGHTGAVWSVAYSTDGARIISGSDDNTIRVWDACMGTMIGTPLEGHTDAVMSIACSTDGARIVSGSYDNTIRVWDACMGTMISTPLEGHTGYVRSVAYLTDGARIVSGSYDNTIRVWDAHTGKMIGTPLKGHTGAVMSIAYSTDGARIVSGSEDNTIRVWDAHTGTMIGTPLEGHTDAVWSVAYSTDGARIISGSDDNTIRVWDAHTGTMIGAPLKGHTDAVMSIVYSADGAHIVSGSYDNTIRVWDAHNGTMIGTPLKGHTDAVMSIAYSTDGARIVSGSYDNTIRVWDACMGTMIGTPLEGHTGPVTSVAYSTDGARIVSGSLDKTIRVWDAHTGAMIGAPLEGHTHAVLSVAYSTDGSHIVSGSSDNTIRVTNLGHTSNDPCHAWVLGKDGYMIANSSKLVMWVPPEVRNTLLRPQNTAVISTQGSVKVDFTNTHIGDSWAQCYSSAQNYNTKASRL